MQEGLAGAVALHRSGRLKEAEKAYRRVLAEEPRNAEALHLLGLLAHQAGDNRAAVDLIERAIAINGERDVFRFNLGVALAAAGRNEAAEEAYRSCLAMAPQHADAHNNLGLVLQKRGDAAGALASFRAAVRHDPGHAEAQVNLGRTLQEAGEHQAALACFGRALAVDPDLPEAHFGRGRSLEEADRWADALAAYRAALARRGDFREALNNLATSLLALGRTGEAQEAFLRLLALRRGPPAGDVATLLAPAAPAAAPQATRFLLRDRMEQLEYLMERGLLDRSFEAAAARYREVLADLPAAAGPDWRRGLDGAQQRRLGRLLDGLARFADAPRLAGPAVNPGLDFRGLEAAYLEAAPRAVWFDDFLTPEAFAALRGFCLESTIYFGCDPAGYVSATLPDGFNCSLMYQIAEELKARLPRILGPHHLSNMWSYRHVAEGAGVAAHTDYAAVTFNFWLTPDRANRDPGSGGLVLYANEEPYDWDWMEINKKKNRPEIQARIAAHLAAAEEIVVPYRANRALLFHSNLFHKSDAIRFEEGFENRRINVSLLFGRRGTAAAGVKP